MPFEAYVGIAFTLGVLLWIGYSVYAWWVLYRE